MLFSEILNFLVNTRIDETEIINAIRVSQTKGLRLSKILANLHIFGSFTAVLENLERDLRVQLAPLNEAEEDYKQALEHGSQVIPITHESYPPLLRQISNPPLVLYVKGNAELLQQKIIGIVGARIALPQSKKIAFDFAKGLSENKITVASGFARGIDTQACLGALEQGTIQVLASGLNIIYPKQNERLFYEVLEKNGVFVSEHPFNMPHSFSRNTQKGSIPASNFPMRNRIISGMSEGVLVVQAAKKNENSKTGNSGTLNTAYTAIEQGKKIFAIPASPLEEAMKGCNDLIKNKLAQATYSWEEILDFLGQKITKQAVLDEKTTQNLTSKQSEILKYIPLQGVFLEEVAQDSEIDLHSLRIEVSTLEILGFIVQDASGRLKRAV
jgi:DNA processing protein